MLVYNLLDELEPDVRRELEKREIYRRFAAEQMRLKYLAAQSIAQTGKLNSPELLRQNQVVTALAQAVLDQL